MIVRGLFAGRADGNITVPSFAGAAALLLVLVAMASGVFIPVNGLLYDAATLALAQPAQDNVVVIEVSSGTDLSSVGWADLARDLINAGSRSVAFTFVPPEPFASFHGSERVYMPFPIGDSSGSAVSPPDRVRQGVVVIPPAQNGIHRTQFTQIISNEGSVRTLEAAVANTMDDRQFYLRFPGGLDGIPRMAVEDVLEGRIPEELLANRVVLIGQVSAVGPGLTTPVNPDLPVMAPLIFHAFALQTLLSGSVPRSLSLLSAAALVIFSAALGTAVYLKTAPRHTLGFAVLSTLFILVIGLLALGWFDLVFPITEMLVVQLLLSQLIWRRREEIQDLALQGVARRFTTDISGGSSPNTNEEWPNEILELEESFVIRLDARRRFPAEARAQLRDLNMPESILDGSDPAFEKAAKALAPVPLKTSRPKRWVAPISREGLLIGYWLIRPKNPESASWLSSARAVGAFSAAIADLLLPWQHVARRTLKEQIQRDLSAALVGQRARVRALEHVLNQSSVGISVRDILGTEILSTEGFDKVVNAAAHAVGRKAGPLDLVGSLTGLDGKRSAAALRFVLSEKRRISLPMAGSGHRHALLNISWLEPRDLRGAGYLLFQIMDFSQATQTADAQRTANKQLGFMIRNDLEAVGLACAILGHPEIGPQDRAETLARMREAIDRARQSLLSIEPFLQSQALIGADDIFLLQLEDVLKEIASSARQDREVKLDMPDVMAAVMAAPETLRELLRSALDFLADDARSDAAVAVLVFEDADRTRVEMTASSTGLSQEQLEDFLSGGRKAQSQSLRKMVRAARNVSAWGGSFEGHADAQTNIRLVLTLKKLV